MGPTFAAGAVLYTASRILDRLITKNDRTFLVLPCILSALLAFAGCGSPTTSSADPSLSTPGTVSATSHPLVASYSVATPGWYGQRSIRDHFFLRSQHG